MQKKHILSLLAVIVMTIVLGSCKDRKESIDPNEETASQPEFQVKGDSMLYGLSCDGTSDSVVVIWPFGGDPITLSCVEAKQTGRIIGRPTIGDWIGVMRCPDDSMEAEMVIDLDQLKGTWTYPVLPVMKDLQSMSKRMQRRMMENMPDSVKNTFFVPREYGFTLKRGHVAQAVGRVMRKTTLEDDSPVVYPEVRNYKGWYMCNGRLLLLSGQHIIPGMSNNTPKKPDEIDTLDFISMDEDSLILMHHNIRYGFHRKENALKANEAAQKAMK